MIDDEIDRRAHFVITETPYTVPHTGPTQRASQGHVVVVDVAGIVVAASAALLRGEGRGERARAEGRCHLVALAPALSRICVILCSYAARLARRHDIQSYVDI